MYLKNKLSRKTCRRESYSKPLLKSFGSVGTLTQSGTTGMAEMGAGGGMMGGVGMMGGGGMAVGARRP